MRLTSLVARVSAVLMAVSAWAAPGSRAEWVFLVQDSLGGVTAAAPGLEPSAGVVRPAMNRPVVPGVIDLECPPGAAGAYQLFENGAVLPIGGAKPAFFNWGIAERASALAVAPDERGCWIAAGRILKSVGEPPRMVYPSFEHPIADIDYDPQKRQLTVLLINGDIALCRPSTNEWAAGPDIGLGEAIDIEMDGQFVYLLTNTGAVYAHDGREWTKTEGVPELGEGLARDLEPAPEGPGLYLLDAFGVIHAIGGAPPADSGPFALDTAVDLEIIESDGLPRWFPAGWTTTASLEPAEISLDPLGPPKTLYLRVDNAENLSSFTAEVEFDPDLINIVAPRDVQLGSWWERSVQGALVHAGVDPNRPGVITLYGGGAFSPYQGAAGGGDLVKLSISARPDVTAATTEVALNGVYFQDASPLGLAAPARSARGATVRIRPSMPSLELTWSHEGAPITDAELTAKPAEVLRADLWLRDGGRVRAADFTIDFSTESLRFLGMVPGGAWYRDAAVWPSFSTPAEANALGRLENQRIVSASEGGCRGEPGALASMFFAAGPGGQGLVQLEAFQLTGLEGAPVRTTPGRRILILGVQ